ncbi:hypothetical protein JD844_003003 [Phrynosoma platyrhinos]|uniref:Uncharacterized protein n=1 Tax=Phrynosoma platyrhinos TaxID=52577 RepID=A0ABQ7TD13_PHRPL|nr:hypothetical protein JD844_003003 [Phrynosoma platyrhinos]
MEVHPGMSFYNDVQDATALVTKTLESANHLTPLHIPPGPVISPERYEELRETFELCKPVMKGRQESAEYPLTFPESHRKYEPPYKFNHEHHYYGNVKDTPLRLPDLPENSVPCVKAAKNKPPGTCLVENRYRPFHPYIHGSNDITGNLQRNEGADGRFNINGERESFPSATSQVRPLEGRIARALQGKPCHISDPQQQDCSDVHSPPLHYTNNSSIPRCSEEVWNNSKTSPGAFQQDPDVDSEAIRRSEYLLQDQIQPQIAYQGEISQVKKSPQNKFRKITDTWKTDKLYQRQLAVPPEPEPSLKPADSIYYEDLPPSRINTYIVWHHPVILSKPGPKDVCFRKPMDKRDPPLAPGVKDIPVIPSFPAWIPNCGVARPQTKLLDIQNSFSKGDAIKRLNDLTRGGVRDLRDHDREGRRHKFQGTHAYFYH